MKIAYLKTRIHSSRMRTVRCSGHLGGVYLGGVGLGGVSAWGGCLPGGVYTSPPCGQTDTCKNITFTELLLRTVKNYWTFGIAIVQFYDSSNMPVEKSNTHSYMSFQIPRKIAQTLLFIRMHSCQNNSYAKSIYLYKYVYVLLQKTNAM